MSGTRMNSITVFDRRRRLFLGLVAATGLLGLTGLLFGLAEAGVGLVARVPLAILFALTFTWIAVSFWHAVIGFLLGLLGREPIRLHATSPDGMDSDEPLHPHRTAMVMPVHNEDPVRVTAGLAAMARSLADSGRTDGFEFFVLSDTRDPDILRAERAAVAGLQRELDGRLPVHYRHRENNAGRKAGNLAEFCRRWGRRYEFMLVLDADSLMDAASIRRMVATMQANPSLGLIQTIPLPAGQHSLFARLMQWAAAVYAPMLARGQAFWQGRAANYWGHNALVRIPAFMASCGLPELPGKPPLGGEILSHDFVEAALLRRDGWSVILDTVPQASFEEVPANLIDYARRDRRWMQGNLQHLRLLRMPGLHPTSRLHFLFGAAAYLSSLAWLGLLLLGVLTMLLHPVDAASSGEAAGSYGAIMLAATLALLFGPRLLGLTLALIRGPAKFGGRARLLASGLFEALAGILLAPIMLVFHARFAVEILAGYSAGWSSPPRGDRGVPFTQALVRTGPMAVLGLIWLVLAATLTPQFLWWMSPVWVGLILAPLLAWATSQRGAGKALRRAGLLLTPAEIDPPQILQIMADSRPRRFGRLTPQRPPSERPGPMPVQRVQPIATPATASGYDQVRV